MSDSTPAVDETVTGSTSRPTLSNAAEPSTGGASPPAATPNWNERHQFSASGTQFLVDKQYTPVKSIGSGAYGIVCSAMDTVTQKKIAIKKISAAFDDLIDAKRILREIKLLSHFKHDNVIRCWRFAPVDHARR